MSIGNASPERSVIPDTVHVRGVWTGGGAATDCSHVATDWSRGIASIAYTSATGCYTITFTDVGQQVIGFHIGSGQQTGVNPLAFAYRNGTFSAVTKTLIFEVSASDSGTLTDLLTTDKLFIDIVFSKQAPPA